MKSRERLGKILVVLGVVILLGLVVTRFIAVRYGVLHSFDDGGWRVLVPFIGTVCLGGGLFALALSGGGRAR